MRTTWLRISVPKRRSRAFATPPAATRAAVSRALARSRIGRRSSVPYLSIPARSAWPGRGRVIGSTWTSSPGAHTAMRSASQLTKSLLGISSVSGLPMVRPWRRPDFTIARSVSIFMRPPRP